MYLINILVMWMLAGGILLVGDSISHMQEGMANMGIFSESSRDARKMYRTIIMIPLLLFMILITILGFLGVV